MSDASRKLKIANATYNQRAKNIIRLIVLFWPKCQSAIRLWVMHRTGASRSSLLGSKMPITRAVQFLSFLAMHPQDSCPHLLVACSHWKMLQAGDLSLLWGFGYPLRNHSVHIWSNSGIVCLCQSHAYRYINKPRVTEQLFCGGSFAWRAS
jgi:hypothetical protein